MKNGINIGKYAGDLYGNIREEYQKNQAEGKSGLSSEEIKLISDDMFNKLYSDMINEKVSIDPNKLFNVFKKAIPFITKVSETEKETRAERRTRAVKVYARGMANNYTIIPEFSEYEPARSEQRLYRLLEEAQLQEYIEYYKTINWNLNKNNVPKTQQEIKIAKDKKDHLVYNALKKIVDESESRYKTINNTYSDDQLISEYENLATLNRLMVDGGSILNSIKSRHYKDINPEELEAYNAKLGTLMSYAVRIEKRIAVMADPYYTEIKLEDIFDASPSQLSALQDNQTNWLKSEGIKVKDEGDLAPDNKANNASPAYTTTISDEDNVLCIANDTLVFIPSLLDEQLADALGISFEELKSNMLICDSKGNQKDLSNSSVYNRIQGIENEFYIMSKYGDSKPIPVLMDKTKGKFSLLIGSENIKKAETPKLTEPKISYWAMALNGLSQFFRKRPTKTMEKYLEDKELYDYSLIKNKLGDGELPIAVKNVKDTNMAKSKRIIGFSTDRAKEIDEHISIIRSISREDHAKFENSLAKLIVNWTFYNQKEKENIKTIIDVLGALKDDFNEEKAITELKDSNQFKEFAWKLRKDAPQLIENLKNTDINIAYINLNKITKRFLKASNGSNFYTNPISDEYKQDNLAATKVDNSLKNLEVRLNKLGEQAEYKNIVAAAKDVLENGSPECKKLLARLSDENLKKCDEFLKKNPEMDFNAELQKYASNTQPKSETMPEYQQTEKQTAVPGPIA